MANVIRLDDDTANYHAGKVHQVAGDLPSVSVITQISGNRTEDAPEHYTRRLQETSTEIGKRVSDIRAFVAANADALRHAVAALRDTDRLSASEADRTSALIGDVATGGSLAPTSAVTSAAAGAAAGAAAIASRKGLGS